MEPFRTFSGTVLPLPLNDIDTDMIIPAQYLTSVSREGYGSNLFRRLRDQDPHFPLNVPQYRNASILLSGDNFGCGSSREHAVWAIQGAGFKAVIAESFADIFSSNSGKNGLVLISLPSHEIRQLMEQAASNPLELTIDLENLQVSSGTGSVYSFEYDAFRQHCLLNGLDDLDYLLQHQAEITSYFASRQQFRYFSSEKENNLQTSR
jgi:3-isopropylmalate/(R)-2-methylmalate dehydratase small subunit